MSERTSEKTHMTIAEIDAITGDDIAYWLGNPFLDAADLSEKVRWWVTQAVAAAHAEVGNAFVEWAAKNEIAEPPLDWAWFGEIARRYSPLHEEHGDA